MRNPGQSSYGAGLRALIVDDEEPIRALLAELLELEGFSVECAATLGAARQRIAAGPAHDLYLLDKNLPDGNGLDLVGELAGGDHAVIVMTAYASLDAAVEAIELRVADFITKPFVDLDALGDRLRRAVEVLRLKRSNAALIAQLSTKTHELEALAEELRDKHRTLEALVTVDPLTGLHNHAAFQGHLARELERSRRYHRDLALLMINIDNFKAINNALGHAAGDALLREFGQLLGGLARRSDAAFRPAAGQGDPLDVALAGEVAARFGGDEFALLLPETTVANAAAVAERIRALVAASQLNEAFGLTTCSIGIAAFPADAQGREELIEAAGHALATAKLAGRDCVFVHAPAGPTQPSQTALIKAQLERRAALDQTVAAGLIDFVYQPIVRTTDFEPVAYEALCRPRHPGLAHVGELIHVAEVTGRIYELGRVLRRAACAPLTRPDEAHLLFVNLHPQELHDPELIRLDPTLVPHARRLVYEITETQAIRDVGRLNEVIARLHALGVRVALDDVGAGYAGLNLLAQVPVDFVKLDMQLVRALSAGSRSARLIAYLLEYAREEGQVLIAEGIESPAECQVVAEIGIPLMQGFYFARGDKPWAAVDSSHLRRRHTGPT